MTDQEKKHEAMITEWFKNHIVEWHDVVHSVHGSDIEKLMWRKPGTSIYLICYIRVGNYLFVSGDVGEAVYAWSEVKDLRWISELDLSYFSSKCRASETGIGYPAWSGDKAREVLEDRFSCQENTKEKKLADQYGAWGAIHNRGEWHHFLSSTGHDVFGDDYADLASIGEVTHIRCQTHLVGLRMAFERMKKGDTNVV